MQESPRKCDNDRSSRRMGILRCNGEKETPGLCSMEGNRRRVNAINGLGVKGHALANK